MKLHSYCNDLLSLSYVSISGLPYVSICSLCYVSIFSLCYVFIFSQCSVFIFSLCYVFIFSLESLASLGGSSLRSRGRAWVGRGTSPPTPPGGVGTGGTNPPLGGSMNHVDRCSGTGNNRISRRS